jgi:iron(III) transport system substrate-binding protein
MLREYLVPRRRGLSGALIAVGLVAALCVPAASPAPAPPAKVNPIFTYNKSDREQHLYQCAQQEGKVVFYTSSSAATTTLQPAFQKQYPGVSMQVLVATADLPTKLKQEEDAGQHNFDVYGDTLGNLGRDYRYFQPIWTPRMGEVRPYLSKPYFVAYAGFLEGLVYNPNVIGSGDVPRTWKDLLQPKWQGKVYMGIDTGTAGFIGLLDRIYGDSFIDQLAKTIRVQQVSGRAIADQVIAGTIPIGINISSSYHKTNYLDRGQPLRWVPLDPVPGFFQAASISKNAPHPCAAALLVDWLMSKDGAQPLWNTLGNVAPFKGAPLLPYNLKSTSPAATIPSKWNVYMTTNPSFYKGYKNYQAALTAWQKIIQTKFTG